MDLSESEKIEVLTAKWVGDDCQDIGPIMWKLTRRGIFVYGAQLAVVEIATMASIYIVSLIIDYLKTSTSIYDDIQYSLSLFFLFAITRLVAIVVRNYYDLHVYNYYRFV